MTELEVALISGGLAIAGTLLGVIFTYRLSIKSADRQFEHLLSISKLDAKYAAAQRFVEAFSEEVATVEGNEQLPIGLDDYLRRAYHAKHKMAVASFRSVLAPDVRHAFDKAWYEYHSGQTTEQMMETGVPKWEAMFIEYMGSPFEGDPYRKATERLRKLLVFASHES